MQYEISAEVEKVAKGIIKEHLTDLKSKNIKYVTQEKKDDKTGVAVAQMRKGNPIIGDIKIVGGLNAFLASGETRTDHNGPTPFVSLVVSRYAWNNLTPEQRKAWVHQQLNRLHYDIDTGKPSTVDFDIKEFSVIAKLYGAWNDGLNLFLKAAKQHPLFEDLDNTPDPVPAEQAASAEAQQQIKVLKGKDKEAEGGNGFQKELIEKADEAQEKLPDFKKEVQQKQRGARAH